MIVISSISPSCNPYCLAVLLQLSPSRRGGVSSLSGGSQRPRQDLPSPPPSHHPLWHRDRPRGRGGSPDGERERRVLLSVVGRCGCRCGCDDRCFHGVQKRLNCLNFINLQLLGHLWKSITFISNSLILSLTSNNANLN